jgi:hypothetical protein
MAVKIKIFGKQFGFGIAEAMLSMALGVAVLSGGVSYFGEVSQTAATSTVLQDKTSRVTESLNRTAQNIQISDPVIYAAPDQMMTASVDPTGAKVMTRWLKANNAYYQQIWTGFTGSYMPDPGLWIDPSVQSGTAPNGDGQQNTTTLIADMSATGTPTFAYTGATGNAIDTSVAPLTTTAGNTNQIKLISISLSANTVVASDGTQQFYANTTSAAPRNTAAGVSDGVVAAPVCPALSFTAASTPTQPELTWTAVPGAVSYVIYRNAAIAATPSAPATTWKDTANPAGVSDSTTYRVLAQSAGGATSDSCRPAVWRPQIGLPVLINTSVQPAGPDPSAWNGSPLTTPRVVFNWNAVTGTSGYELLYREVDPATGNPLGTGAYTNIQLASGITTYTWDNGGWGRRYEWYLKADARSGQSSESRHIQVLTHPTAPANTTVKASYVDNTNGTNDLTWTAVSSASRYDIWRYNAGNSGTTTLVGSTTNLSYSDTVPYGTTYTYYVAARNSGPRGTDAAGNDVTADRSSPSPESAAAAANKAAQLTQLQYPPIPTVAPLGAAATNTRDYDGTNRIIWNPATSATGYQVGRFTVGAATLSCLTGATAASCNNNSGGTTATQLDDPAAKGTQSDYAVIAYNATGMSKAFSLKARLTQRPAAPPLTLTRAPDLTTDTSNFSSVQNADAGNAVADQFCTASTCSYELDRNGTAITTFNHAQSGQPISWTNMANPSGSTLNWTVKAKNPAITGGGWSDTTTSVVNTYPGPFTFHQGLGDVNGWGQSRLRVNLVDTDLAGSSNGIQNGYTTLSWGASAGASWIDFSRSVDNFGSTSGDPNVGLPNANWLYGSVNSGGANHWTVVASPGTWLHHNIWAHAPNGLVRPGVTVDYWTPPDVPQAGTTMITCSGDQYSDQTTATWDWPNHHIGTQLIAFNHFPLYGAASGTSVIGMTWYKGQGPTDTSWTYLNWNDPNPGSIASGQGQGYYYGVNNGERVWTNISGGPNGTVLWQSIQAYATFNSGCGPYGGWWYDMWEPTWACYGYVPGQPCQANNPWNRPQWHSF